MARVTAGLPPVPKQESPSRIEPRAVIVPLVLCFVGIMVLYPVFLLLHSSLLLSAPGEPARYGLAGWQGALGQPGILEALFNTLTWTAVRVSLALVIATPIAWALARTDIPGANWLEFGFWIGFFLPALPVVLGWILVFDPTFGVANQVLGWLFGTMDPVFNIYSWWGIVWAHLTTVLISVMVILLMPAFRNLDTSLDEASRMSGASGFQTFRRITLPLMAPAILLAVLFTTIRLLEAFEVELILGVPDRIDVYSTKIYRLVVTQQPPQFAAASALGVLILFAMVPLVILYIRYTGRRSFATLSGKYRIGRLRLGAWRWPAFSLVALVLAFSTLLPLSFLLMSTFMKLFGFIEIEHPWTLDHWRTILNDAQFLSAAGNTVIIATGTAIVSLVGYFILSYLIVRKRGGAERFLDFFTWVPFMLPGVLLSLTLFWAFLSVPLLTPLFGSTAALIMAMSLANMTLGVQLIKTVLLQLGKELEEASAMSGATRWHTLRFIVVPLTAPALITVSLISFAATARNVSHIILLGTSKNRPLSLLQLDYMVDGTYEAAAVVGVITAAITIVVAVILRRVGAFSDFGNR